MSDSNFSRLYVASLADGETSDSLQVNLYSEGLRNVFYLTLTTSEDVTIHGSMGNESDIFGSLPHALSDQPHTAGSKTYVFPVNPGCRKFEFTVENQSGNATPVTADAGANRGQ